MGRGFSFIAFASFPAVLFGACIAPVYLGTNASDAGAQDSGSDAAPALCLLNPMFYGSPTTDDGGITRGRGPSTKLPGWQICDFGIDINPGVACMLQAPDGGGTYYVGLDVYVDPQGLSATSLSTPLTPALPPGSYPFTIDLGQTIMSCRRAGFPMSSTPVELRIYGSMTPCGRDELLWRQPIMNFDSWMRYPGTLTAHRAFSNLVFVAALANGSAGPPQRAGPYVIVADFISQTCLAH